MFVQIAFRTIPEVEKREHERVKKTAIPLIYCLIHYSYDSYDSNVNSCVCFLCITSTPYVLETRQYSDLHNTIFLVFQTLEIHFTKNTRKDSKRNFVYNFKFFFFVFVCVSFISKPFILLSLHLSWSLLVRHVVFVRNAHTHMGNVHIYTFPIHIVSFTMRALVYFDCQTSLCTWTWNEIITTEEKATKKRRLFYYYYLWLLCCFFAQLFNFCLFVVVFAFSQLNLPQNLNWAIHEYRIMFIFCERQRWSMFDWSDIGYHVRCIHTIYRNNLAQFSIPITFRFSSGLHFDSCCGNWTSFIGLFVLTHQFL